jgi:pimeloyl-ACP methyl ester carboxylesterase
MLVVNARLSHVGSATGVLIFFNGFADNRWSVRNRRLTSTEESMHAGEIRHSNMDVNGAKLHVARVGQGRPLLLLHGWPEFWLTWEPIMMRLADRFELIAPDLRGFGDSDMPKGAFGPEQQADDMSTLIAALHLGPVGVVAHDIGGAISQALARKRPEQIAGLFFFDFIYPGIGDRFMGAGRGALTWYFHFHQSDLAPRLLSATPETVRLYISHFLKDWAFRKDAFDGVLDAFVSAYQRPGVIEGSLAHYRARRSEHDAAAPRPLLSPAPIDLPTCVRWAEHDKLFDFEWTDRLPEFFGHLDLELFPGVGHFPHREDPDRAADEISKFFGRLERTGWKR